MTLWKRVPPAVDGRSLPDRPIARPVDGDELCKGHNTTLPGLLRCRPRRRLLSIEEPLLFGPLGSSSIAMATRLGLTSA